MSGDARTGLAHELRVNEGLWVWVLVALEGPVVLLVSSIFAKLRRSRRSVLIVPIARLLVDAGSWR
jgi:hypothetical protein